MLNKDPNFRDYVPFHGTSLAVVELSSRSR